MTDGPRLVLDPLDEGLHDPGTASNYNESVYLHAFDTAGGWGGWFRLGNRPHEGHAEMSVCLYLPDGRVAFAFARPAIADNSVLDAGGLRIEVVEPFHELRLEYAGPCLLLDDPEAMSSPRDAYRDHPQVPTSVALTITGIGPMWGGRQVDEDGRDLASADPEQSFGTAHYEQHIAARGWVEVDGTRLELDGFGLRDKSWGPRHWQAISWYRFLPVTFGPDFAMMLLQQDSGAAATGSVVGGMVLRDGAYTAITECTIDTDWDGRGRPTGMTARVRLADRTSYVVRGEVLSLVPLRHRRQAPDGTQLTTRLTEAMTRFTCGERTGVGMSEYLDQVVDGRPAGPDNPA